MAAIAFLLQVFSLVSGLVLRPWPLLLSIPSSLGSSIVVWPLATIGSPAASIGGRNGSSEMNDFRGVDDYLRNLPPNINACDGRDALRASIR